MIRVFARKTNCTPTDELAFFDEPPLFDLFDLPKLPVYVSVTFSWDIQRGVRLANAWSARSKRVQLGGPAFDDRGDEFVPGRFLAKGYTITSRGCPKRCPYCFVPAREGKIRELPIADGWRVQDNNLLACSLSHVESVFEMLSRQPIPASFLGGLDLDFLQPWHVELLKSIKVAALWVAFDTEESLAGLSKAADLLSDFSIEKRRAYVLIGYKDDSVPDAERRLETVYEAGFLPFAMLYRDTFDITPSKVWKKLQRKWARPAIYRVAAGGK